MLLMTVAPLFFGCFPDNATHLAWVTQRRDAQGVDWLDVEHAWGEPPLPASIRLEARAGPPPPPPVRVLNALSRDGPDWKIVWTWSEERAPRVLEIASKISVAGTVVKGRVDGAAEPASGTKVRVAGPGGIRVTMTQNSEFEVLGLPPGTYSFTTEIIGYRQRVPIQVEVRRCVDVFIPIERYGIREWALEKSFPLRSLAMAAWSLASELLVPAGVGRSR